MAPDLPRFGEQLPSLRHTPPGPASQALAARLRAVESRNVTYLSDEFPVFWSEASGANVRDADGNVYIDLTAAFGVLLAGHRPPAVERAMAAQMQRLVHGMGDVHPPEVKVLLLEAVARFARDALGWSEPRTLLANSGSEAVEAALKTAQLASGRTGIVALEGGYHGLTMGSLAVTGRSDFRAPFGERLFSGVARLPFPRDDAGDGAALVPAVLEHLDRWLHDGVEGAPVGTIIVEPVQARGGVRRLPEAFAAGLMERVRRHDLVLVADEIYTGLGRCGAALASPLVGLQPHIVCLGKVLGGGLPLSACVADRSVMDAWPASKGEALHTSTFLGHPLACSAALAMLEVVADGLPDQAAALGRGMMHRLCSELGSERRVRLRGLGLLIGIEVLDEDGRPQPAAAVTITERLLREGVLVLPAGEGGSVVELSPPATLNPAQVDHALERVIAAVRSVCAG